MFRGFSLFFCQSSKSSPPILTSYSLTGTCLPDSAMALLTAHLRPVQQGTSMWTTVMDAMLFCFRISVSFAA